MEGVWSLPTSKMGGLFGSKACAVWWRSGMRRVGGGRVLWMGPGARCLKHLLEGDATASLQLHVQGSSFFSPYFSFFSFCPNTVRFPLRFCTSE